MKQMAMNASGEARGKQMNVAKLAPVARPEELVGLNPPQHVEPGGAFVDRRADGQRHQHEPDAVLLVLVVEAVLIEIERPVVEKAVLHRGDALVEAEDV